jgi:hypothetical protein
VLLQCQWYLLQLQPLLQHSTDQCMLPQTVHVADLLLLLLLYLR